ncbi:MAG TPA: hypothetical protein VJ976_00900 [Ornithinimicrobium sp.]|uniref:hypothetical protein n=1 Tax=Ornithinimicrobium sp. TaxID=1977084 RepID=UPI002B46C489|nr:hypothetical protein [Ornithinimicrobium sp.]HKJ10924.1 hypothetical protein [Ornithinimicrobium sp.]
MSEDGGRKYGGTHVSSGRSDFLTDVELARGISHCTVAIGNRKPSPFLPQSMFIPGDVARGWNVSEIVANSFVVSSVTIPAEMFSQPVRPQFNFPTLQQDEVVMVHLIRRPHG